MIEFMIVAVPILLLGLGSIEAAHWLLTRQVVSLALLEAGRAGINKQAHPDSIAQAFEQALLPLFPATQNQSAQTQQQIAFRQRQQGTTDPPWQITILSPSLEAFQDFADPKLNTTGLSAINNNYQFEQNQRYREQGWANGLGPSSGLSIYQANTLTLHLNYLHQPLLPGVRSLLRTLGNTQGTYSQRAMSRGYLPLSREISLTMQSHPVRWPMPGAGHVIRPGSDNMLPLPPNPQTCTGLWCLPAPGENNNTPGSSGSNSSNGANGADPSGFPGEPTTPEHPPGHLPGTDDLTVDVNDPACGVTLCCAPY